MFPLESESVEVMRDARLFARWIRQGKLTVEQARADILLTARQLEIFRADHASHVLRDMLRRRTETWNALVRLLAAEARRKAVPLATTSLRRRAVSA